MQTLSCAHVCHGLDVLEQSWVLLSAGHYLTPSLARASLGLRESHESLEPQDSLCRADKERQEFCLQDSMNKTSQPSLVPSHEGPCTSQQPLPSLHLIPWSVKQWLKGLLSLTRAQSDKQECLTAAGGGRRSLAQYRLPFL